MFNAYKALHNLGINNYITCYNQYFPHLINNSNSFREYLIKKIRYSLYL